MCTLISFLLDAHCFQGCVTFSAAVSVTFVLPWRQTACCVECRAKPLPAPTLPTVSPPHKIPGMSLNTIAFHSLQWSTLNCSVSSR